MKRLNRPVLIFFLVILALVLAAAFVLQQNRIDTLRTELQRVGDEKSQLASELAATQAERAAAQTRADGLATRVSALQTLPKDATAPSSWRSETISIQSEFDKTAQPYLLITPVPLSSAAHPLVLYLHSKGNWLDEVLRLPAKQETLVSFLVQQGAIIASPAYRGDSWLNPAASSDVTQVIRDVQSRFRISSIILAGISMGGSAALMYPLVAPPDIRIGGIVAGVFASDVTDLWSETKNPDVKESLRVAYGGSPAEQPKVYADRSVLRNLIRFPASLPIALYASYADSMIPTVQQTRLRDGLAGRGNPMLYVVIPGDHKVEEMDQGFAFVLTRAGPARAGE